MLTVTDGSHEGNGGNEGEMQNIVREGEQQFEEEGEVVFVRTPAAPIPTTRESEPEDPDELDEEGDEDEDDEEDLDGAPPPVTAVPAPVAAHGTGEDFFNPEGDDPEEQPETALKVAQGVESEPPSEDPQSAASVPTNHAAPAARAKKPRSPRASGGDLLDAFATEHATVAEVVGAFKALPAADRRQLPQALASWLSALAESAKRTDRACEDQMRKPRLLPVELSAVKAELHA